MKLPVLKCIAAALALFVNTLTQAANDVVVEKTHKVVDLNADGTFSQTSEVMVRLVSEQGAKGAGQVPLAYSESLQTLDVIEAYTLKPDGTRLDVPADKIFTQAAPIAVSAPVFNDIKYKIIVFPEPLAGGKIYFRASIKQKTPFFPNHFSHYETVAPQFANEAFSFRLSAPVGFAIKTDMRDVTGGKLPDKDGRSHWEWKYTNKEGRSPEPFELAGSDVGPYIAISSFNDWSDLAKAYRDRAASKVNVSAEIQALADDITKGMTDPKAQTQAIYHWVARNVRYVGVFLGLGGFVPRDTADILKTKYGDCKDHTVILESLLRAKKIDATAVLINMAPSFKLPNVPVMGAFNHAISYVPSLDMYLDATSTFARFGNLPHADAGKPVVLIAKGVLATTPSASAKMDTMVHREDLTLKPDGSIVGKASITVNGEYESVLRRQVASVPASEKSKFVTRFFGALQKAEGTFTSTDPNDLEKPFAFSVDYEIKDAVSLQSPGAFPPPRGFPYRSVQLALTTGSLNTPTRKTPFLCGSATLSEEFTLQLPDDIKVLALPKNISHKEKTLSYEANYLQEGQKILISRKLVTDREREYCDPSMWAEVVRMRDAIARDARAQVLIQ